MPLQLVGAVGCEGLLVGVVDSAGTWLRVALTCLLLGAFWSLVFLVSVWLLGGGWRWEMSVLLPRAAVCHSDRIQEELSGSHVCVRVDVGFLEFSDCGNF